MAEFSPEELDGLEDGLEHLEGDTDLDALDLPDTVRARLEEYGAIMELTREAFPEETPDESVLRAVMAEATAATAEVASPPETPFWQRWRKSIVPVLALAGTTAAVLWIVSPESGSEPALPEIAAAERSEDAKDTKDAKEAAAPGDPRPASATLASERSEEPDVAEDAVAEEATPSKAAEPSEEALADPSAEQIQGDAPNKKKSKSSKAKGGGAGMPAAPIPEPEPAAAPAPTDKDSLWELVSSANKKRLAGSCGSAIALYRQVVNGGEDALARARAHAGIGLCLEYQGRAGEAKAAFTKARATSAGIDAWIQDQRNRMPEAAKATQTKEAGEIPSASSKKSKPQAKKRAMPDEASEKL
jgi:hypothetical protein